jgi:hypothetical protein
VFGHVYQWNLFGQLQLNSKKTCSDEDNEISRIPSHSAGKFKGHSFRYLSQHDNKDSLPFALLIFALSIILIINKGFEECRLRECDSAWLFLRTDVSEERRFLQEPHGVTSLNTAFFIVTIVNISNLT